ncbi:uncharacterized protein RB166_004371 [Leptodactylus fuscus]
MAPPMEYYRMDLDVHKLIESVEAHPNLYEKKDPLYSDRHARDASWITVCQALYPDWATLSREMKDRIERDVRKRWKSVRDRFLKDIKKVEKSGASPSKKNCL